MDLATAKLQHKIQQVQIYIYQSVMPLQMIRFKPGNITGAESTDFDDTHWDKFTVGAFWGGRDTTTWFRIPLRIDQQEAGQRAVVVIQPGKRFTFKASEGGDYREYELLVYLDGQPLQSIDIRRNEIMLWDKLKPGKTHLLAIEAFSGLETHQHCFEQADLVFIDAETEDYHYNLKMAFETMIALGDKNPDYPRLFNAIRESLHQVDFLQPATPAFYDSVKQANQQIKADLFTGNRNTDPLPDVTCVGHSHLDIAWMWQTRHSRKKAARTFSNALRLMDMYPEYTFIQSQPQLYKYIKEEFPQIYERVKEKIISGQWEAAGGMWVESDCNLPGGESFVRQFLIGKRFFEQEFGVDDQVVWLPDVFGFCYSLPQIIKKCGLRYFTTTKLSWSQYTRIPYDTFYWQGIDGTRILTHFITTPDPRGWNDYSIGLHPTSVKGCWDNYHQQKENDEVLLSFGWGDGGGGPTREMLENSRRMAQLNSSLPNQKMGRVGAFFERLENNTDILPVWNDELYLQFHRGCYTTQAWIKQANRQSEILFHNAELLAALSFLINGNYPHHEVNTAWELILLNQFHDILPGSSIPEVYADCRREYAQIQSSGETILQNSLGTVLPVADTGDNDSGFAVINTLSHDRSDLLHIPYEKRLDMAGWFDAQGQSCLKQVSADGNELMIRITDVPALGYTFLYPEKTGSGAEPPSEMNISTDGMENRFFVMELDGNGLISRLYDKRHAREVLPEGARANLWQIYEDRPARNDAWNMDIFDQEKCFELTELQEITVTESGPLRSCVRIRRKYLDSVIIQHIYIYLDNPRIDFETEIDWQQHQTLVKAAFPVNIHAVNATYEIPFGCIERPTHRNTAWDEARYEVSAHKWADLSEGDYGVSLLNDCKYGYDVKDNILRLTLLKSPVDPDPMADIGRHHFTYALYPHRGNWREGGTVRAAYGLNYPLLPVPVKNADETGSLRPFSLVQCDRENIVIETVKKAEDSDHLVIRLYETANQRGQAILRFCRPVAELLESNLIEKEQTNMAFAEDTLKFDYLPFEIKTFMVKFA